MQERRIMVRCVSRYIVLIIPMLCLLSCGASKSGNLFSFTDEGVFDSPIASLIAVPVQREYVLPDNNVFKRADMTVHVVYINGNTQEISTDQVTITIEDDEEETTLTALEKEYPFNTQGQKPITVSYEHKNAQFIVMVWDPTQNPGTTPGGDTSDDGTFVGIEPGWE
jgi:hypothetical protein